MEWVRFLTMNGIDFVESGPNVARGNVNIRCPFCGEDDQSHHLGISLNGRGWGCWRDRSHRGIKAQRLIQALIHCSYEEASRLVGDANAVALVGDAGFGAHVAQLLSPKPEPEEERTLSFTPELRPLKDEGLGQMFIGYLAKRGYTRREATQLAAYYGLRYATTGIFRGRLIVPILMEDGLANWTGRAISRDAFVRYRTLSTDPEKAKADNLPLARIAVDRTVLNYGPLLGNPSGDTLVVCEGPMDALRVDWLGRDNGVRATCLFGKNLSPSQLQLLENLAERFERMVLLLDNDASMDTIQMMDRLGYLRFSLMFVPPGVKDPAELNIDQFNRLFSLPFAGRSR